MDNFKGQPLPEVERQSMDVDIVCVGFGPAMGGFLTTLSRGLTQDDRTPVVESNVMPGMPPQVICYERADDISFGVSGIVTRARAIRESFNEDELLQIPLSSTVKNEKVLYLLDPAGASRRPWTLKLADRFIRTFGSMSPSLLRFENDAIELPFIPSFLSKEDGLIFSMGQFMQWAGAQVMGSGLVQIWPATPVASPLIEGGRVTGVRLVDQGADKQGNPEAGFMPGMDIKAALTVVGDGPVGAIGDQLDAHFGMPEGHHRRDWAVGIKMVVDLPENCTLEPGTVIHTLGYPEPEIFGFMYVYPDRVASLGIFVQSFFDSPIRTSYRYLQHWMQHPYLWRHLEGGAMRSWGAKSLQESGKRGEPYLSGDGYARIGEGSGSTNVLTNSGVDEAWATGVQLAEGVLELMKEGKPYTKENLEIAYVKRRRSSWVEKEGIKAGKARDGFQRGFVRGMIGTMLSGLTGGRLFYPAEPVQPYKRIPKIEDYFEGRISAEEIEKIRTECNATGLPVHDALMERAGWPQINYDGKLLVSHQDALLMGGKVQAPPGYADHVIFLYPYLCLKCENRLCIEICSGQAIMPGPEGIPSFDREKCIHCGACLWNCSQAHPEDPERTNIEFRAGSGGLHSGEN